jgi:hypothetical protein
MEIAFLLAGLPFLAIGVLIVLSEARTRRGAVEVPAQLVGFSLGASASGGPSFHAVARYAGLDGQSRYLESSVGSSSPLGTLGDPLCVFVQPDDPDKAAIKSSLPFVLGVAIGLMGLISCTVFFAVFRLSAFSLAGALAVVGLSAWKLRGSLREKPLPWQAWSEYKSNLPGARIFTDATKGNIRWADPGALQNAQRKAQRTGRIAAPVLVLAGAGLAVLGVHLYQKTGVFLQSAVRGRGTVVELAASHSSSGTTWAPVVEFEHEGRRYRFKDAVSASPASHRRGDAVEILYDPSHPSVARIDHGFWDKAIPVLVAAAGALFCWAGGWIEIRRRRAPLAAQNG